MTRPRSLLHPQSRRVAALATVLFASGAAHSVAQAEETCTPACAEGQVCYQRTCMVPAPPAPAGPPATTATPPEAPPASAPSAPGGYPPAPQAQRPGYGYPPQQPGYSYPPSGYSAPPASGYPAQQYPAQQYPAQQYPAQQYPAQQYPAQQYPAQQYPAQQYPYGYQPPPPRRSRLVLLPFIGVHSFVGNQAEAEVRSVGGTVGGLLGFHLSPVFSLAGELSLDVLNFKDVNQDNRSGVAFVMAVVPQFHIVAPTFEIILGPKIGLWIEDTHSTPNYNNNYDRQSTTASGLSVGLNAGIFFPVGRRLSLGGLLTFDLRPFNRICSHTDSTNEVCLSSNLPDSLKMWGLAGALLF